MQQLKSYKLIDSEKKLKELVVRGQVSIIYIHGTARSGSTIAEIILTQLADLAIHQPFRGTLDKSGGYLRDNKLNFDFDIYELGCSLIVDRITEHLLERDKVTVVIKELAGFFNPYLWQRWIEIPDRFLFTIREPHLQYFSWLSAMTDKAFRGNGSLLGNRRLVLDRALGMENRVLSSEWKGTTISCNQTAWQALKDDFMAVEEVAFRSNKKVAVLDSILLRYRGELAIKGLVDRLELNLDSLKVIDPNNLSATKSKILDVRDKTRPMVRKANTSQKIMPLRKKEVIELSAFPSHSQEHIKSIIPLYLDLFYSIKLLSMPSLLELETSDLIKINPFITYAIAWFHLNNKMATHNWCNALAKAKNFKINKFQVSLNTIDRYWLG